MAACHGRTDSIKPTTNAKPHSTANRHNMAAVNATRRGKERVLVRMQAAGTTAARSTELQITLGSHAAIARSRWGPDRSKLIPATVTSAGKQNAVIPMNPLFDKVGIRFTHLILESSLVKRRGAAEWPSGNSATLGGTFTLKVYGRVLADDHTNAMGEIESVLLTPKR